MAFLHLEEACNTAKISGDWDNIKNLLAGYLETMDEVQLIVRVVAVEVEIN